MLVIILINTRPNVVTVVVLFKKKESKNVSIKKVREFTKRVNDD